MNAKAVTLAATALVVMGLVGCGESTPPEPESSKAEAKAEGAKWTDEQKAKMADAMKDHAKPSVAPNGKTGK